MAKNPTFVTLNQCVVIIDRDAQTKLPATVFEYEVPVLEELYGEENISIHSETDVEVDTTDFRAVDAYAGLINKYSQHVDIVKRVYPRVRTLARESGLPLEAGDESRAKFNQSSELVGGESVQSKTTSRAGIGGVESDDERDDRIQASAEKKAQKALDDAAQDAADDEADGSSTGAAARASAKKKADAAKVKAADADKPE